MIDLRRMLQLLVRRKVTPRCPVCQSVEFDRFARTKDHGIALLYEDRDTTWFGAPSYMRVNPAICSRCGHVMLFSSDKLDQWDKAAMAEAAGPEVRTGSK